MRRSNSDDRRAVFSVDTAASQKVSVHEARPHQQAQANRPPAEAPQPRPQDLDPRDVSRPNQARLETTTNAALSHVTHADLGPPSGVPRSDFTKRWNPGQNG